MLRLPMIGSSKPGQFLCPLVDQTTVAQLEFEGFAAFGRGKNDDALHLQKMRPMERAAEQRVEKPRGALCLVSANGTEGSIKI